MRESIRARVLGPSLPRALASQEPAAALKIAEAVIATVALLAISATAIIGTPGAVAFIASAILLIGLRPASSLKDVSRYSLLLVLPVMAALSTIWSDSPERTLRASIQLILTVVATIIVCKRMAAQKAVLILTIAFLAMCLAALPAVPQSLVRGSPLAGPFDSKNQLAFAGHALFALSLAVACDRYQPMLARVLAPSMMIFGVIIVKLSQSGGGVASIVITAILFPLTIIYGKFQKSARIFLAIFSTIILAVLSIFFNELQDFWSNFRTSVLRKDATLTGRTYLWDFADRLSAQHPWIGQGYYSFWRHGNIDAEGLWRWGGISNRAGFNFHNSFIEIKVELGWLGVFALFAMCVGIAGFTMLRIIRRPSVQLSFFLVMTIVIYARSYTETVLIAPFSLMTVFWMATAVYAGVHSTSERAPSHARWPRMRAAGWRAGVQ